MLFNSFSFYFIVATRVSERIGATENYNRSAVAEHPNTTSHLVKFEEVEVPSLFRGYHRRIVREAIEIEAKPFNFNREDGFELSKKLGNR